MNNLKKHLKEKLPWWARIGAKIILARLPAGYAFWQKLGLFRHGYMDEAAYALSVFEAHVNRAGFSLAALKGKVVLEMGPGDSVATAIIAHALGARAILVDAGAFASAAPSSYRPLCQLLTERGLQPIDANNFTHLEELLSACRATYLTNGADAWQEIASESVDMIFSQAVLEHVRLHEFEAIQIQCFRVLKPGGVASHRIDLKDHLGGALNNLRFSKSVWESDFFVKSGFYTNRLRMKKMLDIFVQSEFAIEIGEINRWRRLPTPRESINAEFLVTQDSDLLVSGFDVLLVRKDRADAT